MAVVVARVAWVDPASSASPAESAETHRYGLEISETLAGFVPGSSVVARLSDRHRALRRLLEEHPTELQLVLREDPSGYYEVLDVSALRPSKESESTPPGLAATVEDRVVRSREPRRFGTPRLPSAASTYEQDVVELVNQERLTNGNLPPLKRVSELDSSAETHSVNMGNRNFFAHCDLDTLTGPGDRMAAAGYFAASGAENIAAGYSTPASVMAGWMASPGHRANILSTSRYEIGVGYHLDGSDAANVRVENTGDCTADKTGQGPYVHYWTQNFGRRNDVYPVVIEREAETTASQSVALYVYGAGFAQEMRFSNDGVTWSAWEPYNPNKSWTLSPGNGTKTVFAQIRNGGTVLAASDTIQLSGSCSVTSLQNQTLSGTQTFEDCEIHAGPALDVTGTITFLADLVRLDPGFSVAAGATFRIGPRP